MAEHKRRTTVVLAAVELDGASDSIVSRAFELAAGQAREAHVVTVVPLAEKEHPDGDLRLHDAMQRLQELVTARLGELRHRDPETAARLGPVQLHGLVGEAASEVTWLAASLDADIVVVGTHERREQRRLLLGPVADKVVRVCGCAVMVVRDKHHAAPWRVPETRPACSACAEARRISSGDSLYCPEHVARHADARLAGAELTRSAAP